MSEISPLEMAGSERTADIEQALIATLRDLSAGQRQSILAFAQSLANPVLPALPSLRELAKLPISERNRLLAPYVPLMAEDFRQNPELTEFMDLDDED